MCVHVPHFQASKLAPLTSRAEPASSRGPAPRHWPRGRVEEDRHGAGCLRQGLPGLQGEPLGRECAGGGGWVLERVQKVKRLEGSQLGKNGTRRGRRGKPYFFLNRGNFTTVYNGNITTMDHDVILIMEVMPHIWLLVFAIGTRSRFLNVESFSFDPPRRDHGPSVH